MRDTQDNPLAQSSFKRVSEKFFPIPLIVRGEALGQRFVANFRNFLPNASPLSRLFATAQTPSKNNGTALNSGDRKPLQYRSSKKLLKSETLIVQYTTMMCKTNRASSGDQLKRINSSYGGLASEECQLQVNRP